MRKILTLCALCGFLSLGLVTPAFAGVKMKFGADCNRSGTTSVSFTTSPVVTSDPYEIILYQADGEPTTTVSIDSFPGNSFEQLTFTNSLFSISADDLRVRALLRYRLFDGSVGESETSKVVNNENLTFTRDEANPIIPKNAELTHFEVAFTLKVADEVPKDEQFARLVLGQIQLNGSGLSVNLPVNTAGCDEGPR